MVAQAVRQAKFRGARPFDHHTDLFAVAHLLEEAFRADHSFPFSDTPFLRELGVWLWTLNYAPPFPESLEGFVWIEDNRVVGNVTLGFDARRGDRYFISNVAVKPTYRRQGIARALMETAIEYVRAQNAKTIWLNVRPNNSGAMKLYTDLGFKSLEMRGEWHRASAPHPAPDTGVRVRQREKEMRGEIAPLRLSDHLLVAELLRAATPEPAQAYHALRNHFELSFDDAFVEAVTDFCIGQTTRRWKIEYAGRLAAVLLVRGHRLLTPHHITLVVHPDVRGQLEDDLAAFALDYLAHFPAREIRATAVGSHPEWIAALERQGLRFLNGLTLMELTL